MRWASQQLAPLATHLVFFRSSVRHATAAAVQMNVCIALRGQALPVEPCHCISIPRALKGACMAAKVKGSKAHRPSRRQQEISHRQPKRKVKAFKRRRDEQPPPQQQPEPPGRRLLGASSRPQGRGGKASSSQAEALVGSVCAQLVASGS